MPKSSQERRKTYQYICAACMYAFVGWCVSIKAAPNWQKFMSEVDLVWEDGIQPDFYDGAFIGDGVQGAMAMRDDEDQDAVRLLLGHYSAITYNSIPGWEYCKSRVYAGSIVIAAKGSATKQTMRLDVWNATARGAIITDLGQVKWEAICDRRHRVLIVTTRCDSDEHPTAATLREEWGISPRFLLEDRDPRDFPKFLPPKPEKIRRGEVDLIIQKMRFRGAHVLASKHETEPDGTTHLFVAIGVSALEDPSQAAEEAAHDAETRVRSAVEEGALSVSERHRQWWHEHLSDRFLDLPEDPYWRKFWWLQTYKFACASAEDSDLIIDTQGPWIWKSGWAAVWWNLNVQLSYLPMFGANQLDVGKSLIQGVDRLYESSALKASAAGSPGITIGRSATQDGISSWGDEFGNLPWALHCYWRYCRHSGDAAAAERLYPMLADSAAFLSSHLEERDDGRLHMRPSRSPEYTETLHADANYALMSADWVFRALIALNDDLHKNDPRVEQWRSSLSRLASFPTDNSGLRINEDQGFDLSHRHYSHLLAIYPYHTLNPDQGPAQRELIERSVDRWINLEGGHAGYTYTGDCAMYATLGQGDRALATLDRLKPKLTLNTMYREGGGQVVETPLSGVESITYMLLQSWNGVIRVFPAMPSRWKNATFRDLSAEGAFLVSGEWKSGRPVAVSIQSLAGNPCALTDPWKMRGIKVMTADGVSVPVVLEGSTYRFNTTAGIVYRVTPKKD